MMNDLSLSSSDIYTDSPRLHSNLALASFQLLFWLFFHPSAWNNYIACIDSRLSPDFCLLELDKEQFRNPDLQRVLLINFLIYPIGVALLILVFLGLTGHTGAAVLANVVTGLMVSLATGVIIGASLNVAGGCAGSVIGGLMGGIFGGVLRGVGMPGGEFLALKAGVSNAIVSDWGRSVGTGITAGLGASMLPYIGSNRLARYSFRRQIGGVFVGIFISGFVVSFATILALTAGWEDAINITLGGTDYSLDKSIAASRSFGLALSLTLGVTVWLRTNRWRRGLVVSAIYTLVLTAAFMVMGAMMPSLPGDAALGIASGLSFTVLFVTPFVLAHRVAGLWAGIVAGTLGSSGIYVATLITMRDHALWPILPLSLGCMLAGLTFSWWRPIIVYPFQAAWNSLLFYSDSRKEGQPSFLRWNAAFWDEHQRFPLRGLENHLVLIAENNPAAGERAIKYLLTGPQRWAAQAARIELEARWLESCPGVDTIVDAHKRLAVGELEGPASSLLHSFSRHSQDAAAALNQSTVYNQRLALRGVEVRMNHLVRELEQSSNPYSIRFSPVAEHWHKILMAYGQRLAEESELSQEIDNPYIFGVPLTEEQEIFTGRTDISANIERLLLDRRQPPLLLYGQRRMGKTSLLHNLGRLLPSTIVLLYVDGQGIAGANDYADFLYNIGRQMRKSAERHRRIVLPPLERDILDISPFTVFDEWLDEVEKVLDQEGRRMALFALDEFEALGSVLNKGRFDEEDVLNMLRHLIQHRSRFKVLLAGSHTLEEFRQWASYLINVQIIHMDYLTEEETRQLIQHPVKNFILAYEPEAIDKVVFLTRGHPHLVQLLCHEIVTLKNDQPPGERRTVRKNDVETAVDHALEHGGFFFTDIELNQVDAEGVEILRFMAGQGEQGFVDSGRLASQFGGDIRNSLEPLVHRELIEPIDNGFQFQVELIRRWFAR